MFLSKPVDQKLLIGVLIIFTLVLGSFAYAKSRIVISATASPEFTTMDQDPDKIWFYQLAKGEFFGGSIRDNSLTGVDFNEVALDIVSHLRKRDMYPHKDPRKGDFLVVIHWGSTDPEDDIEDLFPGSFGTDDLEELADMANLMSSWNVSTQVRNASLTGFDKVLYDNPAPWEEYELKTALQDARYFITVNAFDYQLFLHTGEVKLLWTTRISTRSPGTNFKIAHVDLTKAAAGYFGKNLDGLAKERAGADTSEVIIGDIEVIDTVK